MNSTSFKIALQQVWYAISHGLNSNPNWNPFILFPNTASYWSCALSTSHTYLIWVCSISNGVQIGRGRIIATHQRGVSSPSLWECKVRLLVRVARKHVWQFSEAPQIVSLPQAVFAPLFSTSGVFFQSVDLGILASTLRSISCTPIFYSFASYLLSLK